MFCFMYIVAVSILHAVPERAKDVGISPHHR
jgi:hypothetical protein